MVAIGCQKPYGSGEGVNLQFKKETKEDWTWITCEQADPSIPLSPKDLESVVPPEIEMGEKVVISGRMPIWLVVSLAMAYHGKAKAVALYQPGVGSTIAWTHSQECGAGSINLTKRDSSFGWVPRKGKK